MAHGFITGMTLSGKSTLAKAIMRLHRAAGRLVLAYDPLYDEEVRRLAHWTTEDPEKLVKMAKANRSATIMADEMGDVGPYAKYFDWLATQGRHLGHTCLFLGQRPIQVSVTIRSNCHWIACFAVCGRDAAILAEDFMCPPLRLAPAFGPGQYVMKRKFSDPSAGNVFGGPPPKIA